MSSGRLGLMLEVLLYIMLPALVMIPGSFIIAYFWSNS